jgi:DNA-binding CsgD family transcriptional regulator
MTLEDFFKPIKLADVPNDRDYKAIQPYIEEAKIFSHTIYQSVYIIDYYKRGFAYVSDNPLFLCGRSAEAVQKMGYLFYFFHVPKEDLKLLLEINEAGFSFYNELPVEDRLKYNISYDFRLMQANKHFFLVNHKLIPLVLDKSSNIWLALCIVSASSNSKPGNIFIRENNGDKIFQYDTEKKLWERQPRIKLTNTEKEVLLLSRQGLTMEEIAKRLFVTTHAVKLCRGKMLNKMRATNISEAIACAANYRLI